MDSLKVKNFIILVLLIVNVVLLAVVISDRLRGDELWDQSVQGAVALLEENGIVGPYAGSNPREVLPADEPDDMEDAADE